MTYQECEEKLKTFAVPPRAWGYVRGEKREEYLKILTEIADKTNNPRAWGYVHYIKSGRYYDEGDANRGYEEARKALSCGYTSVDWWLIAMGLNNIGVFHSQQENTITAFDYYWRAIDAVKEAGEKDAPLLYILYGNVAECMLNVQEYEKALEYYALLEEFDIPENFVHIPMNKAFTYSCQVECFYMRGQLREAWDLIVKLECLEKEHEETRLLHYGTLVWKYILLDIMGDKAEKEGVKEELLKFHIQSMTFPLLKVLCTYLYEHKELDFFLKVLDYFEAEAERQENLALHLCAVNLRLGYLKETGKEQLYNEKCILYYQLQQQREKREFAIRSASLNTILSVAERAQQQRELKQVHALLKQKSEYDELTGLPNRYKLKEFCEDAFQTAIQGSETISVEILDIDCFKQLNDHYGHPEGDRCLKAIGAEIAATLKENELGARYGGDEFVIVRRGRDDGEIVELMEELKQRVIRCEIPNALSSALPIATISQGSVNRVPKNGDDLKQFLKLADRALYDSKRVSKNSYTLYTEESQSEYGNLGEK